MSAFKNEKFEQIEKALKAYGEQVEAYEQLKEAKRAELGKGYWDWAKENDKPACPISDGTYKAFQLWYWGETEELQMDEFVWEREAHDFIETLREAGIETFVFTNQSTALMENMHWFVNEGCTLVGLCEVESACRWDHGKKKMGVRFEL